MSSKQHRWIIHAVSPGFPRSPELHGSRYRGCAPRMAQEFGDRPETAVDRMRWIRQLVGEIPAWPDPALAGHTRCAA